MNNSTSEQRTYLGRATAWIESLDDLNIENVEAIAFKFGMEVNKVRSSLPLDKEKLNDLEMTLRYLNGVIKEIVGDSIDDKADEGIISTCRNVEGSQIKDFVFDSSSLVNYDDIKSNPILPDEKNKLIKNVKCLPGILKSPKDIKSSELKLC